MARPPEQGRNANTNDTEIKPKVRKVKKSEGSAANSRGVNLARTAPVYSPLAVPLAGAASASTSTDSLQNPGSSFRSQSANSFSANEPRHHSQITLPKGEDVSKKRSSESAGDRKGKKKATPTYTTIAGSHRRDIADAVRNAGLTGTPAAPVSVIVPGKASATTGTRSDSNLLAIPLPPSNTATLATQDRRGGSASQDLSRTVSANTAGSASASSLAGTVASTSSRPRADNDSQKSAKKKKKKKKESASQAPVAQPISGAAGVTVTVLSAQNHARTAGPRSRPPTSRPAITAETQLRTLRPVTPSNTSLRSHGASPDGQAAVTDHLPDLLSEHGIPTTATNLPIHVQSTSLTDLQQTPSTQVAPANDVGNEPAPPPWSAPLSTITLAFTPMHAYLAEFDPEPSSPLSPGTSRLVGPESSPSPAARQHPPVPDSPPPAFRSRTPSPTPEEQVEWPDVDADALTLYERGYNSSETSLELMDDQGRARVSSERFLNASEPEKARYWDARQWEAWRRAGLQLDERLKRMETKGKYKAVEKPPEIREPHIQALPSNESTLLPLAEQAASAGSSASMDIASHASSNPDAFKSPNSLALTYPLHTSNEPPAIASEDASPSAPHQQSPSPTQLASRLQGKLAQGTSRFPSIGSVRRARLKRFEEQRKESKNLTSIIEADTQTSSPPVAVTPSSDSSGNVRSSIEARPSVTMEEVKDRRESITSGLDRLEALLRRGSKRTSATSDPVSLPAAQSIPSPALPIEFSTIRAESMSSQEPARASGSQQGPSDRNPKPEEIPSTASYTPSTSMSLPKAVLEEPPATGSSEPSTKKRTSGIAQILSDQIEARRSDSPGRAVRVAPQPFIAASESMSDNGIQSAKANVESERTGMDSNEVLTRLPSSAPPLLNHQQNSSVMESQTEAHEAIDALVQLEASEEQARIEQQVAEDARLAAELQSHMLRVMPAETQPASNLPIARGDQTASALAPRKDATAAEVQPPVTRQAKPSASKTPNTRSELVVKSPSKDVDRLPVLTLPRAPPRVTTDLLSADNLRRLSRHPPKAPSLHSARSASSSSSNEGDLSLSPIASDSSDSDSADGESTARPPASSLLSYTAGSLPPSVSGSRFDSTSEREVAAASWRRSEDGRRASAILSRPLSIKRKPPPVPPKRWGGIWDRDTVREVLTQGQRPLEEFVEGAAEINRTLRAGPSRLSGVQEEDPTWETVGREDDVLFRDPSAPAWQVVGRDMSERQALPVTPPKARRPPPPPPPLLENVYSDTHSSAQSEAGYLGSGQPILPLSGLPHSSAGLRYVREGLEHDSSVPEEHIYREGHIQTQDEEATHLPPSSLRRSSATRRPLSFQGRPPSRRSSLEDQPRPLDPPNPPSGATRANLKARPRHVYSSSVPSASLSSPSVPHAPSPRPRRPLPRPPIDEEGPMTSAMPSRYYGSENTLHGSHPSHEAASTSAFPAAFHVNSSTAGERDSCQAGMSAARPATAEEIDSLPVGRVELERKRFDRTGKTKQKLSCVGINCNRCEICLLQFKEDELACVLPLCLHVFHAEPCTRSYLSANSRCPTCSTPLM